MTDKEQAAAEARANNDANANRPNPNPRPAPTPAPRPNAPTALTPQDDLRRKANEQYDKVEKDVRAKIDAVTKVKEEKPGRPEQDLTVSGVSLDGTPFSFSLCVASETPEREVIGAVASRQPTAQFDTLKIEAVATSDRNNPRKEHKDYSSSDLAKMQRDNPASYEQLSRRNIITKDGSPSGS